MGQASQRLGNQGWRTDGAQGGEGLLIGRFSGHQIIGTQGLVAKPALGAVRLNRIPYRLCDDQARRIDGIILLSLSVTRSYIAILLES